MSFKEIDSRMDLPKLEVEILDFWKANKIFEKSVESRANAMTYSFFDGPPFATGTPHYGHIVASTMKDAVPRYWTMKGYRVERKWGWDCHGLPIENIAEKELGITQKNEIEKMGVEKFNQICRSKVLEYVHVWEKVIERLGRWADMKNSYKTMDLTYMESVWWVFKELWDKGLIYEGYRAMHICPRCETTLSQSEVAEGYKLVKDISVIAKFKIEDEPSTFMLAWTTTPWTLIGNAALAVNRSINYIKCRVKGQDDSYILAKDRAEAILKGQEYEVLEEMPGEDLIGCKYVPVFDYYSSMKALPKRENGWKVYPGDFVTTDEGTGIVHIAPAYGEDDLNLGNKFNLPFIQHIGMDGVIKKEAGEFAGMSVKPQNDIQKTDVEVVRYLAQKKLLFSKEKFEHSYPHCWRCDTPLLNFTTSSWFVAIQKIKSEAITLAKDINWSPKHIKEGRFGKWLEGARDWSISRQRFWASVIPIWRCEKCDEIEVIGSVKELENLSGAKITDLHKDVVDKITFKCKKCQGKMRRIPDVLDTWFDSGSMPYAQFHYPFQNKDKFEKSFPADFIAEGVDQTRAWFYYLHMLSTALKEQKAYKNVVVNGIVLAEDGKKMSKRLQNYPDPMEMFNKYGADVLRFYLLSSPVMMAENLNFNESEMAEISRGMFRMLWNSYSFFVLYAKIDNWIPLDYSDKYSYSDNRLDRWIISELNTLIEKVDRGMKNYDLEKTTRLFPVFIDNLSNWYIRRSRKRFWKSEDDSDKKWAYQVLYTVLIELSKLMAPFTPFIAEEIYKNLTGKTSVHLENFPKSNKNLIDNTLMEEMIYARKVVEKGLALRAKAGIKVRQPLAKLEFSWPKSLFMSKNSNINDVVEIIKDEVNVKEAKYSQICDDIDVKLDTKITDELKLEGLAREIIRSTQSLRKKTGFRVEDRIRVYYMAESTELSRALKKFEDVIKKEVLATELKQERVDVEGSEEFKIDNLTFWIGISRI